MESIWENIEKQTREYFLVSGQALTVTDFRLIELSTHSTALEGSSLSLKEATELIYHGKPATGKSIDQQYMVVDHHEALNFVLEAAKSKIGLSVELIQRIQSMVMRRTGKIIQSQSGDISEPDADFRRMNISAGGSYFVDHQKVNPLITELVSDINEQIQKLRTIQQIHTLAYLSHFRLDTIHPFTNGNGRTGRLLMNYVQAYHGQPLTLVQSENSSLYIDALIQSGQSTDFGPIINFLAKQHYDGLVRLNKIFRDQGKAK